MCVQKKRDNGGKTCDRKVRLAEGYPTCSSLLSYCLWLLTAEEWKESLEGNMLLCNIVPGALCYPYMPFPLGL